jgi:hypothetical protein
MRNISCLVSPIPDHAFFEQSVFECEIRHDLLRACASRRRSFTSSEVAARAVSPASRLLDMQIFVGDAIVEGFPSEQAGRPVTKT